MSRPAAGPLPGGPPLRRVRPAPGPPPDCARATVKQHRKIRRHAAVTGRFPVAVLSDCTAYPAAGTSALDLLRGGDGRLTTVRRLGVSPGHCKHERPRPWTGPWS
ncbi:hypothetical protein OG871_37555 [Kitasatospora sp. NBC_00374]|uniref:hypothetical protein n=1 Tax=Kitasatospora sp. NBC_00374 TaxID=2975964 RepID=UPI0030DF4A8A